MRQKPHESASRVQAEGCASSHGGRKNITVRFSEDELARLRSVCSEPLSKFIREAALGKADAIDLIARMEEV